MDRKFLEGLGLDKEVADQVMAEYGKSINSYKAQEAELKSLKEANESLSQASQEASGKYTQLEANLKEKQGSIEDLTKQLETANLQNLKIKVALDNGIPYTLADRLSGTDADSLTADAKNLAGLFKQPQSPMKSTEPQEKDGWALLEQNLK